MKSYQLQRNIIPQEAAQRRRNVHDKLHRKLYQHYVRSNTLFCSSSNNYIANRISIILHQPLSSATTVTTTSQTVPILATTTCGAAYVGTLPAASALAEDPDVDWHTQMALTLPYQRQLASALRALQNSLSGTIEKQLDVSQEVIHTPARRNCIH